MAGLEKRDLDNYLFFNGPMPNLAEGVSEVAMPQGFYYCMDCGQVTDYWKPGQICAKCEQAGHDQTDMARGN